MERNPRIWRCLDERYDFDRRPLIMGILNVTPDSFSDGGTHNAPEDAVAHARRMRAEGADIVDVGGESTRPGFDETGVTLEEERRRVMPVVRALVAEGFVVSVDTSKPELMREAAEAGAAILNDIRGFELPGALEAAAATKCGLVVMHRSLEVIESGAVETVERYLEARTEAFRALGVDEERICWDPGVAFGKTVEENIALMAHSRRLSAHHPLMVACSRKSSIGAVTGEKVPTDRVSGSVAAAMLAVEAGAGVARVHDVRETRQAFQVLEAFRRAAPGAFA